MPPAASVSSQVRLHIPGAFPASARGSIPRPRRRGDCIARTFPASRTTTLETIGSPVCAALAGEGRGEFMTVVPRLRHARSPAELKPHGRSAAFRGLSTALQAAEMFEFWADLQKYLSGKIFFSNWACRSCSCHETAPRSAYTGDPDAIESGCVPQSRHVLLVAGQGKEQHREPVSGGFP